MELINDLLCFLEEADEGGAGDYLDDEEGASQLTPQGLATLRHLESVFVVRGEESQPTNGTHNDGETLVNQVKNVIE